MCIWSLYSWSEEDSSLWTRSNRRFLLGAEAWSLGTLWSMGTPPDTRSRPAHQTGRQTDRQTERCRGRERQTESELQRQRKRESQSRIYSMLLIEQLNSDVQCLTGLLLFLLFKIYCQDVLHPIESRLSSILFIDLLKCQMSWQVTVHLDQLLSASSWNIYPQSAILTVRYGSGFSNRSTLCNTARIPYPQCVVPQQCVSDFMTDYTSDNLWWPLTDPSSPLPCGPHL